MDQMVKKLVYWFVILVSAIVLWQVVRTSRGSGPNLPEVSYSQFLSEVDAGTVAKIRVSGTRIDGTYRDGRLFRAVAPLSQEQMLEALRQAKVETWYVDSSQSGLGLLINLFAPLALLAALWFFMIRQLRSKGSGGR
jgi:cell division protease FtsH